MPFSPSPRTLLLILTLLAAQVPAIAQTAASIPAEHFFRQAESPAPLLSPDGHYLAMRVDNAEHRNQLITMNLETQSIKVVAKFSSLNIQQYQWVNANRLIFDTRDTLDKENSNAYGSALYAVDRDGTNFKQLSRRSDDDGGTVNLQKSRSAYLYLLDQQGSQDSDFVYVSQVGLNPQELVGPGAIQLFNLLRLNTLDGSMASMERPGLTQHWVLDQHGKPRIAVTWEAGMQSIFYLDPDKGKWRRLAQFSTYGRSPEEFKPLAFGPDGTFYVSSRNGKDHWEVYTFDLLTGKLGAKSLIALAGYDFSGKLIFSADKLVGAQYASDARGSLWISEPMRALQASIDALLPSTINTILSDNPDKAAYVLLSSESDRQPVIFSLFNKRTGSMMQLGGRFPEIQPAQMAEQQLVHYKARDGLPIPAWLTLPKGQQQKNLPLVVLVHSEPFERGHVWGFSAETQFLASRGYAVLEPEHRGSDGFGDRHLKAGWKQWGLKMQDDIADGARWAIAQGYADASRICIGGSYYGAYSALMGLINDGDLYRCGFAYSPIADIGLFHAEHWGLSGNMREEWKAYAFPQWIGHPKEDTQQFQQTSPVRQAARLTQPLLLAYGMASRRIPAPHAEKLRTALQESNHQVEWSSYEKEGEQDFALERNRLDYWQGVERFLDKNIGKNSPATKKE
ncbi:prolyl oligopeptidase family serine peptidase [Janthinobacterium sp. Mn2066]|uniref:alpha/beta hydrolase family protein n=1 Tax=Janthinobacterium sp. Mn2066 TaxID=3395264 RepID=UPI003BE69768